MFFQIIWNGAEKVEVGVYYLSWSVEMTSSVPVPPPLPLTSSTLVTSSLAGASPVYTDEQLFHFWRNLLLQMENFKLQFLVAHSPPLWFSNHLILVSMVWSKLFRKLTNNCWFYENIPIYCVKLYDLLVTNVDSVLNGYFLKLSKFKLDFNQRRFSGNSKCSHGRFPSVPK